MRSTYICAVLFLTVLSCMPPVMEESLTSDETTAVNSAVRAVSWFAGPAGIGQEIVASQPADTETKSIKDTVAVAGCPTLTLSPTDQAGAFNVSLDFAEGCPVPGQSGLSCSGSVTGEVNFTDSHLTFNFNTLSCGDSPVLEGNIDVDYVVAEPAIDFTGTWDISATTDDRVTRIVGPGTVSYDTSSNIVTIDQFSGQLTRDSTTSNITVDGVQIPLTDNPSLIPNAGTIQLNGGLLRQMTIRFNADSPSTGTVDVSIFGLIFFPVQLSGLVI